MFEGRAEGKAKAGMRAETKAEAYARAVAEAQAHGDGDGDGDGDGVGFLVFGCSLGVMLLVVGFPEPLSMSIWLLPYEIHLHCSQNLLCPARVDAREPARPIAREHRLGRAERLQQPCKHRLASLGSP